MADITKSKISLTALLKTMVEQGASDLHLTTGSPPQFRINGKLVKVKTAQLNASDTKDLCYSILTDAQKAYFEKNMEMDFSFGIKELARFRGNLFFQRGAVTGVFRQIPIQIPTFESLGLPTRIIRKLLYRPNGLILITGPTGSGKSTTLAAMLNILNDEEPKHIITVEDPIEFIHKNKSCIVNQREVGVDTKSFPSALKRILRQDPDYVLVGELRDIETIEMALTLAETGHLVFSTLHTNNAAQSISRIVSVFPPHQQGQIRAVLASSLQAIISQQLISKSLEDGRVLAYEILIPTPAIRHLIREDKLHQVYSSMQTGQEDTGMQTMNQTLSQLVVSGFITRVEAMEYSPMPEELTRMLTILENKEK